MIKSEWSHRRGFTLIELLLVMVIMIIAVSVVASNIGSGQQTANLNTAVRDLTSGLRYTRGHALSYGKQSQLTINLKDNSYSISGKKKRFYLAEEIAITLSIAQSDIQDEDQGSLNFFPDGSSTGGRIILESGEQSRRIDINWLTGQIQINEP